MMWPKTRNIGDYEWGLGMNKKLNNMLWWGPFRTHQLLLYPYLLLWFLSQQNKQYIMHVKFVQCTTPYMCQWSCCWNEANPHRKQLRYFIDIWTLGVQHGLESGPQEFVLSLGPAEMCVSPLRFPAQLFSHSFMAACYLLRRKGTGSQQKLTIATAGRALFKAFRQCSSCWDTRSQRQVTPGQATFPCLAKEFGLSMEYLRCSNICIFSPHLCSFVQCTA